MLPLSHARLKKSMFKLKLDKSLIDFDIFFNILILRNTLKKKIIN